MKFSIVVITRNRKDMVDRCLSTIVLQCRGDYEIIVVDSSTDESTGTLVTARFSRVKYLFLPNGQNKIPQSRNLGISHASGEVIAFLDDDSIVQPGWMEACLASYKTASIGGVGGFVQDTNVPMDSSGGAGIGRITYNGTRIANFHHDPGEIIEIEHVQGCNMSFRKEVLLAIGGFDAHYTGSNVLEETDLSIRVRKAGYKIVFNPDMKVIHTPAPREGVFRETFTVRREYYIARNSTYCMLVNFGLMRALSYVFTNNTEGLRLF